MDRSRTSNRVAAGAALALFFSSSLFAQEASGDRTVYHWERIVWPDGHVEVRTPVTDLVDWLETGGGWIDMQELVDSRGRRYRFEADASQASESEPVRYEMKLIEDPRGELQDEASREEAWRAGNPRASERELEAFRARRANRPTEPPTDSKVDEELVRWLASAGSSATRTVTVVLRDDEPLKLPRVATGLLGSDPAFALQRMRDRIVAIEARKSALELSQAPVVSRLEAEGGALMKRHWLIDAFEAQVGPGALRSLLEDPRVVRVEPSEAGTTDGPGDPDGPGFGGSLTPGKVTLNFDNTLADMREAAQIKQFHAEGFEGETGSGRSAVNDIFLAIIDTDVDADHPAWNDVSTGNSRLHSIWRHNGLFWTAPTTSATATPSHGTKVAGIAMADLMQGQDPSILMPTERGARTGFAPEARFAFIEEDPAGATTSIEWATALSVDVVNLSMSFGTSNLCNIAASTNDAVDAAMLDGVFFAKSASNNGNSGSSCNVGNPGTASGSFTVGSIDRTAKPLNEGLIVGGSSRGGDSIGRAVIAIAAPTGPEADTAAAVDDTYGAFGATSGAAPVVAGSAAVFKEHLIDVFGTTLANDVGHLYSSMLLMGDGMMEDGTIAAANDPADDVYGMGRLRMRMFNAAGMDAPWRMRLFSRVVDDGELVKNLPVNPDSAGVNQPLSSDVERLRATAFWHEPNIEDGAALTADISLYIENDLGNTYTSGNSADHHQRIRLGNVVGGRSWKLRLNGLDVPPSFDTNHRWLQPERKVYVAVYWEDTDRDDADGPGPEIQ